MQNRTKSRLSGFFSDFLLEKNCFHIYKKIPQTLKKIEKIRTLRACERGRKVSPIHLVSSSKEPLFPLKSPRTELFPNPQPKNLIQSNSP